MPRPCKPHAGPHRHESLIHRVLAVVGPGVVVALWLGAGPSSDGDPGEIAIRLQAQLAAEHPSVLVLGNSITRTDLDPAAVARGLGVDRSAVRVVAPDEATRADWTAILRRALPGDHAPHTVLLATHPAFLADPTPRSAAAAARLEGLRAPGDTDLDPGGAAAARDRARAAWLGTLARWAVPALGGPSGGAVDAALARVLAGGAVDPGRAAQEPVVPVVAQPPKRATAGSVSATVDDLVAAARGAGVEELIWLGLPVTPAAEASLWPGPPQPGVVPRALDTLVAAGARVHSLRADWALLPPPAWQDPTHLGPWGRDRLSEAVVAVLAERPVPPVPADRVPLLGARPAVRRPRVEGPGRAVALEGSPAREGPGWEADTPWGAWSDRARTGRDAARPCHPVRLSVAGIPLSRRDASRRALAEGTGGAWRLVPEGLWWVAPDGLEGAEGSGAVATLTGDIPGDTCLDTVWTVDDQALVWTLDAAVRGPLDTVTALALQGVVEEPGTDGVVVSVDGGPVAAAPASAVDRGTVVTLARPASAGSVLRIRGTGVVRWTRVDLIGRSKPDNGLDSP